MSFCNQNKADESENKNVSNTTGFATSAEKMDCYACARCPLRQPVILAIIYSKRECKTGQFRSNCIKLSHLIKAYGSGEFLGIAKEDSFDAVMGDWSIDYGLGLFAFGSSEEAVKCVNSTILLRDIQWYGGINMYIIRINSLPGYMKNYSYLQMDMVDSTDASYREHLASLGNEVQRNNGKLLSTCDPVKMIKGKYLPGHITLTQWRTKADFLRFNNSCCDTCAASGTRMICEIKSESSCDR